MTSKDVPVGGRFARLYRLLDWPPRLAGLNLLWLAGVLAGGVVAGLSPATVALFALVRDYQRGRHPRPWRDFWRHWRAEFARAQLRLGLPLLTVWVFAFYLLAARAPRSPARWPCSLWCIWRCWPTCPRCWRTSTCRPPPRGGSPR